MNPSPPSGTITSASSGRTAGWAACSSTSARCASGVGAARNAILKDTPPGRRAAAGGGHRSQDAYMRLSSGHRRDGRGLSMVIDPFGRAISYVRVSVTDRCDFRCVYCMAEDMTFLPKAELLTLEELDRLCAAFVGLGVRKIRLTGGEP